MQLLGSSTHYGIKICTNYTVALKQYGSWVLLSNKTPVLNFLLKINAITVSKLLPLEHKT